MKFFFHGREERWSSCQFLFRTDHRCRLPRPRLLPFWELPDDRLYGYIYTSSGDLSASFERLYFPNFAQLHSFDLFSWKLLDDRILKNLAFRGQSPDVASSEFHFFYSLGNLLNIFSLMINYPCYAIHVWVHGLRLPNPKASILVNTSFVVLSELKTDEIIRKIGDSLWEKVFELEESIWTSLVDPVAPHIDFIFAFFCAEKGEGRGSHEGSSPNQGSQKHENYNWDHSSFEQLPSRKR